MALCWAPHNKPIPIRRLDLDLLEVIEADGGTVKWSADSNVCTTGTGRTVNARAVDTLATLGIWVPLFEWDPNGDRVLTSYARTLLREIGETKDVKSSD